MKNLPRFLAIVPARCGSKGLPGKNLLPLKNKPLIAWSIQAGKMSKFITKTVISSDCNEILKVGEKYGACPLQRPKELAQDSSPSEPLIRHAIEHFLARGETFDYVVLLQPTSPLRNAQDLDNAISQLLDKGTDALISVYEPEHSPYKSFKIDSDGYLRGLIDDKSPFMRRQDLPPVYMPNGAIYIVNTKIFLSTHRLFTDTTLPFIMPREKSIDIDDLEDFKKAEKLLESMA